MLENKRWPQLYISQACVVGSLVYEVIERKGWREEAGARPNIEVWATFYFLIFLGLWDSPSCDCIGVHPEDLHVADRWGHLRGLGLVKQIFLLMETSCQQV